jgi:hypothetical protein
MIGSATEIITVWFLSHTYKARSHHIWLNSQWILNSFQVFPAHPGMWWYNSPTAPHLASRKQDFAAIQYMFRLFQNDVNWPKWNSQHVRNITDSDSSLFVNEFLHSTHFFICYAHWWTCWAFCISSLSHTTFEHGKAFKNLLSSQCYSPKATFNILKFPQHMTRCSFKSAIF